MKKSRFALFQSVIALVLCVSMLAGTTFAWFTDSVSSGTNTIAAGNLDIELEYRDANGTWHEVDESTAVLNNEAKWEPGHTEVAYLRISNAGNLALKYALGVGVLEETGSINVNGEPFYLSDHIRFGIITSKSLVTYGTREEARDALTASQLISQGEISNDDTLKAADKERYVTLVVYMPEEIGNVANHATGVTPPEIKLGIQLTATQAEYESDSFGKDYDKNATLAGFNFPAKRFDVTASAGVTTDEANKVADEVVLEDDKTSAKIPEGVLLDNGTKVLTLEVSTMEQSGANIVLNENEASVSLDVHVEGVSKDNTQPMEIIIQEVAPKGLNMGNYKFYHVENGITNKMTLVASDAAFSAHNQFKYDPVTGDITLYMATFSEIAIVADTTGAWEGNFDYSWYTNAVAPVDGEAVTEYVIANADQLAAFGAIVGGMAADIEQDSFSGKTVKLVADINLGDKESENNSNLIFYPIGYYNSEGTYERTNTAITSGLRNFEGTFDGNGHTVSNFYQNTWEMKGDHNWYKPEEQYYRDGMGLFGRIYKGTVKNLTVNNFSCDGEIATTGVIAAYADGATFENIAIVDCNPRVYNIGNGGIVGCVGWYAKEANLKTTFKNITVDNSNKISALWGSYDVPCGGIVGQYYTTSGQTSANKPANGGIEFNNCHISAQLDVNNDVCANYQYYAYRYAGMLIGSVSENETIDGHVYPKMDGITASGCTVHFGTWNDYYYCEFEKNGHPSYSGPDDYKFSRIPHSEINFTDSNGNGIIDTEGERASVTGCKHNHTDAEDQRCVYLQFNNLVTGYGWGVTTKVVGELEGVKILDREVADSVVKFEGKVTELANNKEYKLGDIFSFVDKGVKLVPSALTVAVTNLDENNPVSAEFEADAENWENGTLTLSGTGKVTITIQDYYFCTPTTITVDVTDRQPEVKFETKFTGDFLYRVGNDGTVALDKLFKAKEDVTVGTVSVTIEAVNGSGASGTYSDNAIQFNGTGVVKVTITDNDYCIPTELMLEVVDATNLTSATGTTTGGNFVLLCDVNTSTYVNYWNCTVYGNGFEYTLKGAPTAYNSKQGKGIIITKNTVLDNVRIIGDIYTGYGAFTNNDYYNTAIDVQGDTTIQNCYIANCAAPVRARNNVTIINSTLYGGAVANLIIESNTTTLENVTTANYDDGRKLVGMGVVVHSDATDSAKLVIKGTLTQYNFISESNKPSDSYAQNLHTAMFSSNCNQYHFGSSPNRYVNTGIISLASNFNADDIIGTVAGYQGKSLTIQGNNGYVYTQVNSSGSVNNNSGEYKPTTQGAVPPSYSFDFTSKNYVAKTDGSNDYCYEENGKVNISMDQGDTFNWDTSILTIGKGINNYTVSMNGTDYTGKSIAFNTAGDYTVTYTYTDDNNSKIGADGNITTYSVTYTKTVNITVAVVKPTTKHAEFTFGSSNTAATTVTVGNNTYVMPNVSGTSSTIGSTTVDGQTIYYPIVEIIMSDGETSHSSGWYAYFPVFSGAVTITDYDNNGTGDKMTPYDGSTTSMPSGLAVVGDPKTLFKYQSGSNAGETPVYKNNTLVYSSAKIEAKRSEYSTVVQYSYTDNAGATYYYYISYHAPAQSYSNTCVTPDTLITLTDGSQVRVDSLKGDEQLLVWNLETGKYDTAPIVFVDNDAEQEYEIIHLYFSDGSDVKAISEHGFFDLDLGKYVYIDANNYGDYIGHRFVTEGDIKSNNWNVVTLDEVVIETEVTTAWSPVTFEHLCYYTNGVLSMPGGIEGLFNIFEIDTDLMRYDAVKMQKDIETFGLFTIEDFGGMITEEAFNAFNGAYLKVAIAKCILTWEDIAYMAERYIPLMK